ncbi:MAG: hypothetical protein O7B25_15315, partial [Gammaproteobacteria bacterium]|nr:hypothetical protein [Gammaproteobacteria bacterium]
MHFFGPAALDSASDEAPTTETSTGARKKLTIKHGIWRHSVVAIATASVGLICALGLLWWQLVVGVNEAHSTKQIQTYRTAFAGYLNGRIINLEQLIKALAGSELVIDARASND